MTSYKSLISHFIFRYGLDGEVSVRCTNHNEVFIITAGMGVLQISTGTGQPLLRIYSTNSLFTYPHEQLCCAKLLLQRLRTVNPKPIADKFIFHLQQGTYYV